MNIVQLPNRVFKAKEEREKNEYVNYIRDVVLQIAQREK